METVLLIAIAAMSVKIITTKAILRREEEVPPTPFLGKNELWSERGRAVEVWGLLCIPVHARAFNHSTLWLP